MCARLSPCPAWACAHSGWRCRSVPGCQVVAGGDPGVRRFLGGIELAYSLEPSVRVSHVPLRITTAHSPSSRRAGRYSGCTCFPFFNRQLAVETGGVQRAVLSRPRVCFPRRRLDDDPRLSEVSSAQLFNLYFSRSSQPSLLGGLP